MIYSKHFNIAMWLTDSPRLIDVRSLTVEESKLVMQSFEQMPAYDMNDIGVVALSVYLKVLEGTR